MLHLLLHVSKISNAAFNIQLVTLIDPFYPYNSYDGLNIIILTRRGDQIEDYTTQNCLYFHQDAYYVMIINRIRLVSGIIHTITGVYVCQKVHIKKAVASVYIYVEIICMYKDVKKTKDIRK